MQNITKLILAVIGGLLFVVLYVLSRPHTKSLLTADPELEPDKFAWQLFAYVNQRADSKNSQVLWQTWASTDFVFADPNKAPRWSDRANVGFKQTPINQLSMLDHEHGQRGRSSLSQLALDSGAGQEVRMNEDTFNFIVANNLWYLEGQEEHFNDSNKLEFPSSSIEVKAVWRNMDGSCDPKEYHCIFSASGDAYALIALHITSRALPNWFWATFEHRTNPIKCSAGCRDSFGAIPPDSSNPQSTSALLALLQDAGLGPEWKNYFLVGSQFDFMDSTGKKLRLGNPWIEFGFAKDSSCITCHSRATVDQQGNRLPLTENGNYLLGPPRPQWFYRDPETANEKRTFFQLDFVWSLCQAKSRKGGGLNCSPPLVEP